MLIPKAAAAHRKEALHPEGRVLSCDVELPASLGFQSESLDTLFDERSVSGLDGAVFLRLRLLSLACCMSS